MLLRGPARRLLGRRTYRGTNRLQKGFRLLLYPLCAEERRRRRRQTGTDSRVTVRTPQQTENHPGYAYLLTVLPDLEKTSIVIYSRTSKDNLAWYVLDRPRAGRSENGIDH